MKEDSSRRLAVITPYDRNLDDIFDVQDELHETIAATVGGRCEYGHPVAGNVSSYCENIDP